MPLKLNQTEKLQKFVNTQYTKIWSLSSKKKFFKAYIIADKTLDGVQTNFTDADKEIITSLTIRLENTMMSLMISNEE